MHTPGPWNVAEPSACCYYGGLEVEPTNFTEDPHLPAGIRSDRIIARCNHLGRLSSISESERSANAHLIAAAPDLLEACKAALEDYYQTREGACWCHELHDDLAPDTCAVCKIQAALAKTDVAHQ